MSTRLDGHEPVAALRVGDRASRAAEVGIERGRPPVPPVQVATGRVGLPDLDQRARERLALAVERAAADRDPLPDRLPSVLREEVVVVLGDALGAELGSGDLGDRLREVDERRLGVAQPRRLVPLVVERRVRVGGLAPVARRRLRGVAVPPHLGRRCVVVFDHAHASNTTAMPWPTPMHSEATP